MIDFIYSTFTTSPWLAAYFVCVAIVVVWWLWDLLIYNALLGKSIYFKYEIGFVVLDRRHRNRFYLRQTFWILLSIIFAPITIFLFILSLF